MNENDWEIEKKDFFQQIELLKNEIEKIKNSAVPAGAIQAFAMEKAPDGWLICDGKEYAITEAYQALFDLIGNTFGGNGHKKTFCVPDLQGQFVRGWDTEGNIDPERKLGSEQKDAFQGHGHSVESSALTINESGKHVHPICYCQMYEHTGGSIGDKFVRYLEENPSEYNKEHPDIWPIKNTLSSSSHTHNTEIESNFIGDATTSKYDKVRCYKETRPKNMAFLYCIKY